MKKIGNFCIHNKYVHLKSQKSFAKSQPYFKNHAIF